MYPRDLCEAYVGSKKESWIDKFVHYFNTNVSLVIEILARLSKTVRFSIKISTVELDFKNCQNKNLLDFKNQITNYQLVIYVVNYSQDKNILDLNQNGSERKKFLKPSSTLPFLFV